MQACPFKVDVYAEDGEAALEVTKLENPGLLLEGTVCASVIAKVSEHLFPNPDIFGHWNETPLTFFCTLE